MGGKEIILTAITAWVKDRRMRLLLLVLMISACAGNDPPPPFHTTAGEVYEIVNRSGCVARIVLYGVEGYVVENQKYEDLKPGRTERYRLPHSGMRLEAVPVDAMGNACSAAEARRITITKVQ